VDTDTPSTSPQPEADASSFSVDPQAVDPQAVDPQAVDPQSVESLDEASPLAENLSQSAGSYELVLSAVVLGFGGYWIDRWLGTAPIFLVSLTVLGFLGAGLSLYYRYKHQIAELNAQTAALREETRRASASRHQRAGQTAAIPTEHA
jgi:F0F1-type ATP synthase assembly protein I